ncbi:hypothetical protein [Bythopirellula goksoeyrii]|uniref:Uncharacterized protein n=1 Tax=Bythopirellula goksoeyrii TaxID=1400387 RepID=A0A5B9QP29_9BACT|nr:hypothetical protein [Bythopirellula goksoeyrii]QEG35871.1 hypothetical protein Pr1d_31770 [Bythopirellula goksoeyrii]
MKYPMLLGALVLGIASTNAYAQSSAHQDEEFVIAYRLPESMTLEFDNQQKAREHLDAVRNLGCEVSPAGTNGHDAVTYLCPKWKSLTVASDELAHQWEEWLTAAGFTTLHGHEAEHEAGHTEEHGHDHDENKHGEEHEEVMFRLSNWATLQPEPELDSQELLAIAKGLGCEVQEPQQTGQPGIQIRCVDWKHLELSTHEDAEYWQQWLTKAGFEANHED